MFETYLLLTGLFTLGCGFYAFSRTRDAMHPATFVSPLFLYFYCVWPLIINGKGGLPDFFTATELEYVALFYLVCIGCLFLGMLDFPRGIPRYMRSRRSDDASLFSLRLSRLVRKRLYILGVILGLVAIAAYWYSIINVGGFINAFSRAKGGGWVDSGYIGEAPMLAYPAVALVALARQRVRVRVIDILFTIAIASPHLIQGVFGGRRGPLFLILAMLFISWYIAKGSRPSFRTSIVGITIISLSVLLVWSQRQHFYIGSDEGFSFDKVIERVSPEAISTGDEYLAGVATVLTADEIGNFYWGYRYFVTFLIRPIPKQLWPTKYEDVGADWLYRHGDEEREDRYLHAVGFTLLAGSSTGYAADIYYEFSWGAILVSFILGRLLSTFWVRHRSRGGLWTILFLESLTLSIYLPTQSLTAFLHRLIFMGVITFFVWKYWVQPTLHSTSRRASRFGRTPGSI